MSLLDEGLLWCEALKIPVLLNDKLDVNNGATDFENITIYVGEKFTSKTALTIVLFHEMGHLLQFAYWKTRQRQWLETPDPKAALLEEELAWLAGEMLIHSLDYRLPSGWAKDRERALDGYYRHYGHSGVSEGRAQLGFDAPFFERARRAIRRDDIFRATLRTWHDYWTGEETA